MSPQLTIQQLEHAIGVFEKRVEAKRLELESYAAFRDNGPAALMALSRYLPHVTAIDEPATLMMLAAIEGITKAAAQFFSAKHTQATFDLEDLELNLKAMRQMRSGVVGASRILDPFNNSPRR